MNAPIRSLAPSRLMVIGDVMLDRYQWGRVQRISPEAPVPVVHLHRRTEVLGGAGNVAANIIGLGSKVSVTGWPGKDTAGQRVSALLAAQGIENDLVTTSVRTTTKTRIMARGRQLLRLDDEECVPPDAGLQQRTLACVRDRLAQCQAVVLSDYGKGLAQFPGFTRKVIDLCRRRQVPLFVDPKGNNWERYRGAICLTPNTAELEQVVGGELGSDEERLAAAAQRVREGFDLQWLLVTRGSRGMCLVGKDGAPIFIAAQSSDIFDVCGAGDTVIAVLATAVAGGWSFPEAARLANEAAGVVVGKMGTFPITLALLNSICPAGQAPAPLSPKITSLQTALKRVDTWRGNGDSIVFTNGCFDLLHAGHIHLIHQAGQLGRRVVVGLNADNSVRRLKGRERPIVGAAERGQLLAALDAVDLVVVFEEDTPEQLIRKLRPDVLVKGGDYGLRKVVGHEWVESYGGRVHLIPRIAGLSTSGLIDRIGARLKSR